MASLFQEKSGCWAVQLKCVDGTRRTIRLGVIAEQDAKHHHSFIERLNSIRLNDGVVDKRTQAWLDSLSDTLSDRLAACGLVAKRRSATLGAYTQSFIDERCDDLGEGTRYNLVVDRRRLIEHFGEHVKLSTITTDDARAWIRRLKRDGLAKATISRSLGRAKQFFHAALKDKLIQDNPFADIKRTDQVNSERNEYVSEETIYKVINACPNAEYRTILALARFAGLRIGEICLLKWENVVWENHTILVTSPKTKHCGKGERSIPIFKDLRPYLEDAFELAEPGSIYVCPTYRSAKQNLRTNMVKIIRRAGVVPWPRTFQNLRASMETDLVEKNFSIQDVTAWLGHTPKVALAHYLQVKNESVLRAAGVGIGVEKPHAKIGANVV